MKDNDLKTVIKDLVAGSGRSVPTNRLEKQAVQETSARIADLRLANGQKNIL